MAYTETLSSVYQSHFKIYLNNLKKLIQDNSNKHDLVISEHMNEPGA